MADNHNNENADIEYLVNTLEEELNLINDYDQIPIDPQAKEYLKSFAKYSSDPNNRADIVSFIDCGIKIMNYLQNKQINENLLSNQTIEKIIDEMVEPQILLPTIEDALKRLQESKEKDEETMNRLSQVRKLLQTKPLDKQKIKEVLGNIKNMD